jgi:hypothetical protein
VITRSSCGTKKYYINRAGNQYTHLAMTVTNSLSQAVFKLSIRSALLCMNLIANKLKKQYGQATMKLSNEVLNIALWRIFNLVLITFVVDVAFVIFHLYLLIPFIYQGWNFQYHIPLNAECIKATSVIRYIRDMSSFHPLYHLWFFLISS